MSRRTAFIGLMVVGLLGINILGSVAARAATVDLGATPSSTDPIYFKPEITFPGLLSGEWKISDITIVEYIRVIFIMFIWVVGIVATVMVVYGGIKWVAAAGNPGRINDARDIINSAIIGVIIALSSVVLLNIINPQLTSFKGIGLRTITKELADFYTSVTGSITQCPARAVKGDPNLICTSSGACSAAGTLNDWINASMSSALSSTGSGAGWPGSKVDPAMVKAIIAKESLIDGRPVSRATAVKNTDGTSASSAYGIGQFVADTLKQQLTAVRRDFGAAGLPDECQDATNVACRAWLDNPLSNQYFPSGLKAQVYMVTNYLSEISDAPCVKGDLARTAAAYYLGQGNVKYYCDPAAITGTSSDKQADLTKKLDEAKQYVTVFAKYYKDYCAAAS